MAVWDITKFVNKWEMLFLLRFYIEKERERATSFTLTHRSKPIHTEARATTFQAIQEQIVGKMKAHYICVGFVLQWRSMDDYWRKPLKSQQENIFFFSFTSYFYFPFIWCFLFSLPPSSNSFVLGSCISFAKF